MKGFSNVPGMIQISTLYDISHWIRTYIRKLISTLWIFKDLASNNPRFSWTVCQAGPQKLGGNYKQKLTDLIFLSFCFFICEAEITPSDV